LVLRKKKKNSFDKFYFWRSIKLTHKLKTDKSFLNWIKRRYGDRFVKEFDKTAFLWKYNVLNNSFGNKFIPVAKAPVRNFLRKGVDGRKVFLDSKAAYANGKIRIPFGRIRDFYFLNRQKILRHLRKSLFAFKATTGFLFYSYNIRGWNDRMVNHVKCGDKELFLDMILEEEIISKTNDIFIPSFWFFRFPSSDIFSKFFTNSLFDVSLDLTSTSGVVMRMQTFLNNFNSLNYNSLYPNGPLNTLTLLSNFVDYFKYPYNAFFNFEKQFLDSSALLSGIYNNSVMTQEKIFDLLLAEKIRVVSYHKMLKYIKQYDNLVFNRKVGRFSSLENVFLQEEHFLKYSHYLNFSSFLHRIEPFFFSYNERFFIKNLDNLFIKNFSLIDHYVNLGYLRNIISFPSVVSMSSGILNYIHFSKDFILRRYLDDFKGSIFKFLFFKFDELFVTLANFINKIPSYLFILFRLDWIFSHSVFDFFLYFFFIYFPLVILLFLVFFYKRWFLGTNQSSRKYVEEGDGKFSLKEDFSSEDSQISNPHIPYKVDQFKNPLLYNYWKKKGSSSGGQYPPLFSVYTDYNIEFRRKIAKFYKLSYLAQLRFSKQKIYGKKHKLFLLRYSDFASYGNKLKLKVNKDTKKKYYEKLSRGEKPYLKKDRFFRRSNFLKKEDMVTSKTSVDFWANTRKHNFFTFDSYRVSHMLYGDWFFKKIAIFKPTQRFLKSSLFLKKKLRNMMITYRKNFYSIKDFMIRQKLAKRYFDGKSASILENDFSLNFGPSEWYSLKFEFLLENKFFINLKNYYNSCFELPSWSPLRSFDLLFLKFFHKNKAYCSNSNFNKNMYLRYKYTFFKAVCTYKDTSPTNWSYFFNSYSDAFVDDVFSGVFSNGNFLDFFYLKEYPNYISLYKNGFLLYRFDKLSLFSSKFNLYSKSSLYMLKGTKKSSINVKRFYKELFESANEIKKFSKKTLTALDLKGKHKKKRDKEEINAVLGSYYNFSTYFSSKYKNRLAWSGKRRYLGQKIVSNTDSPFFSLSLSSRKRRLDNYRYVKRYYYDFYEKNSFLKYLEDNYRIRQFSFWWLESFYFFVRICFVVLFFFFVFLLIFKFYFLFFKFFLVFKKFIFYF
jgi:hypothetical protein